MFFLRYLLVITFLSASGVAPLVASEENLDLNEKYAPFVYFNDDPSFLILAGEIDIRTSLNFSRFVLDHGAPEVLLLDSPGGIVHVALDSALKIDALGIKTIIPEEAGCYSACAFMFLAGNERYADGELGVHQISSERADLYDGQLTLADMIDVLNKFDTPAELLVPMLSTPPEEMYILSRLEIERFQFNGVREEAIDANKVKVSLSEIEEEALFVADFLNEVWSGRLDQDPFDVVNLYAPEVQYYGDMWTKAKIIEDKIAFAARWPVRDYKLLPERSYVTCNEFNVCSVRSFVSWSVKNPNTSKAAAGESKFDLVLRYENNRFFIVEESSTVIKRQ